MGRSVRPCWRSAPGSEMSALVTSCALRTCLGSGETTFAALLAGRSGIGPLRHGDPTRLRVSHGHHLADTDAQPGAPLRAGAWLADCVAMALRDAGVDPARDRVACLVGTGLRELGSVEAWEAD